MTRSAEVVSVYLWLGNSYCTQGGGGYWYNTSPLFSSGYNKSCAAVSISFSLFLLRFLCSSHKSSISRNAEMQIADSLLHRLMAVHSVGSYPFFCSPKPICYHLHLSTWTWTRPRAQTFINMLIHQLEHEHVHEHKHSLICSFISMNVNTFKNTNFHSHSYPSAWMSTRPRTQAFINTLIH